MNEFESLWWESFPTLSRLSLTLTPRREDAEDLVANTALETIRRFHNFSPAGSFLNWATRIMVRIWVSTVRDRKALKLIPLEYLNDENGEDSAMVDPIDPFAHVIGEEFDRALAALQQGDRTLILGLAEGLGSTELAQRVGGDEPTMRVRVKRARRRASAALRQAGYLL